MSKRLQIEIDADTDGNKANGYEVKITPIDIPIADDLAEKLQFAILAADQTDAIPGDGQLEKAQKVGLPVKINFWFIHLNQKVDVEAQVVVRVKES